MNKLLIIFLILFIFITNCSDINKIKIKEAIITNKEVNTNLKYNYKYKYIIFIKYNNTNIEFKTSYSDQDYNIGEKVNL